MQTSLFSSIVPPLDTGWRPSAPPDLSQFTSEDPIFFDTETSGLNWRGGDRPVGIALALPNGQSHYIPFGHNGGNLDEARVKEWARTELRFKHLVGLNLKFDFHMMREWGVDLEEQENVATDVSHMAALIDDNRRKFSLEALSQHYLGRGKVEGLDVTKMVEYHSSSVQTYARRDAELTRDLYYELMPIIQREDLNRVLQLESDVLWPTLEMEKNATPIDVELLQKWIKEAEQKRLRLLWEIHRETGVNFSPAKTSSWVELYQKRGIKITHYTEDGKPSFEDAIVAKETDPVVHLARKAKKLTGIQSKYLHPYADELTDDCHLPFQLHQLRADEGGTVTGRFSSSNVNIQQVMAVAKQKETLGDDFIIRNLFVPKSGQWLSADAMQIEYRLFAHYSCAPKILEEYTRNPLVSYHQVVWDMVRPYKEDIPYKSVKNLNFAKLYGAGIQKIAEMLGVPLATAKMFVSAYDQAFPEVRALLQHAARTAESRRYVKTIAGRRSRFVDRRRLHKALNCVIQGSAADVNKQKIVDLHSQRKKTGFVMRMTVHDEVCGDSPDQKCTEMVTKILNEQSFDTKVPILWDVNTGSSWGACA